MDSQFDLVVIGAGWAGLASAKTYHQLHPERSVAILDNNATIGGVWAEERLYPGLKTNNLVGTYEYPDFPLTPEDYGIERGQHIPGRVVHAYLARYAESFDVADKIRYNCTVHSAEHVADGGWKLLVETGAECGTFQLHAKRLVVATGLTSQPFLPNFEGQEHFGRPLFHSKEFTKYAHTVDEAKSVTVFGGTKSAWDAVYAYASRGVHVNWVIRASGHGPVWQTSPYVTPLKRWLEQLASTRFLTWFSPCSWATAESDGYPLVRALLHRTAAGRALTRCFWWLLGRDVLGANAYHAHPETARLRPWSEPFFTGTSFSILNYDTDFFALVRESGRVHVRIADPVRLAPGAVHLSDGTSLETDLLVCATGWRHVPPVRFLPAGIERELGLPHALGEDEPCWRADLVARADAEILMRFPRLRDQPAQNPRLVPLTEAAGIVGGGPRAEELAPYHLHRFLAPPSPALLASRDIAFPGHMMNFVHAVIAHVQALWITAYFDGALPAPGPDASALPRASDEVLYQAVLHSRFGRWRYPSGHGNQFPDFVFDALPYIDLLLGDMGLKAHRKTGCFAEVTKPYMPADYRDLVAEWAASVAAP